MRCAPPFPDEHRALNDIHFSILLVLIWKRSLQTPPFFPALPRTHSPLSKTTLVPSFLANAPFSFPAIFLERLPRPFPLFLFQITNMTPPFQALVSFGPLFLDFFLTWGLPFFLEVFPPFHLPLGLLIDFVLPTVAALIPEFCLRSRAISSIRSLSPLFRLLSSSLE